MFFFFSLSLKKKEKTQMSYVSPLRNLLLLYRELVSDPPDFNL